MEKKGISSIGITIVIFCTFFIRCQKLPNMTKVINNEFGNQYEAVNWLEFFKENGINSVPDGGETVIETAAQMGDLNLVKAAVKDGADVNIFVNRTAVYYAAFYGFYDIVEFLLKEKAIPYYYDAPNSRYYFDLIQLGVGRSDPYLLGLVVPYYSSLHLDYSIEGKPMLFELPLGIGYGGVSIYVDEEAVIDMINLLDYFLTSKIKLSIRDLDIIAGNITYINTDIRNYDITPIFLDISKMVLEYYLNQDYLKDCLNPGFNWDNVQSRYSSLRQYINTMRS